MLFTFKVKISLARRALPLPLSLKTMLTVEPIMIHKFQAHSPILFEHMSFWCRFLDVNPKHTTLKYLVMKG